MPCEANPQRLLARDVIRQPAIVIGPGASLGRAVALMTRYGIDGLPVGNDAGRPIGRLT